MNEPKWLVDISISEDRVDAVVWSQDKSTVYSILLAAGQIKHCDCVGFQVRNYCSHIRKLIEYLYSIDVIDVLELLESDVNMSFDRIQTSLTGFNESFGGIPHAMLFGLFGSYESGKTLFAIHLGFDILLREYKKWESSTDQNGGPKKVLYIDAESGIALEFLREWIPTYNKRFGIDVGIEYYRVDLQEWLKQKGPHIPLELMHKDENKQTYFVVIDVDDLHRFLLIHGRPCKIKYGKKVKDPYTEGSGMVNVIPLIAWNDFPYIWDTPISKWVEQFNIAMMVYDSITAPVGVEFIGEKTVLPGRSYANKVILSQAQKVCKQHQIPALIIHHPSRDPGSFDKATATGGQAIGHNHKFFAQFTKQSYKPRANDTYPLRSRRKIAVSRISKFKKRMDFLIDITDDGLMDV